MIRCVCGHWHTIDCPHCGCTIYEPDDGTPTHYRSVQPPHTHTPYNGRYKQPRTQGTKNP